MRRTRRESCGSAASRGVGWCSRARTGGWSTRHPEPGTSAPRPATSDRDTLFTGSVRPADLVRPPVLRRRWRRGSGAPAWGTPGDRGRRARATRCPGPVNRPGRSRTSSSPILVASPRRAAIRRTGHALRSSPCSRTGISPLVRPRSSVPSRVSSESASSAARGSSGSSTSTRRQRSRRGDSSHARTASPCHSPASTPSAALEQRRGDPLRPGLVPVDRREVRQFRPGSDHRHSAVRIVARPDSPVVRPTGTPGAASRHRPQHVGHLAVPQGVGRRRRP